MRSLSGILSGMLLAFAIHAACAQNSDNLFKVPPAQDRRVGDAKGHDDGANMAKPATPAPATPDPSPEPARTKEDHEAGDLDGDDDVVPKSYPLSRYVGLWKNSPFQMESIAPPEQSEGLAQRFVLGGILRENGEPVVWIRERATQESFKLNRNATNNIGLSLVQIDENKEKQSDATATIRLGNEQGVIKFDVAASVPVMPGMGGGAQVTARPGIPYPAHTPQVGARVPMPAQPSAIPGQPVQAPGQHSGVAGVTPGVTGGVPGAQQGIVQPVPGPGIPQGAQVQQVPGGQQQIPSPRVIRRRAIVPAAPIMP